MRRQGEAREKVVSDGMPGFVILEVMVNRWREKNEHENGGKKE